ncbi:MAG: thioesterase family protein [Syntrophobacteraceae bacterium]|jgi:acyl-CoA thioester hydrolase
MEEKLLEGFPVIVEFPVVWGEMDALGHVNNVAFFRYFENARVVYFDRVKLWEFMEKTGIGPILASTQCRFRAPLSYPDVVSVGASVSDIGPDRFTMKYSVASHRLSKIAAEGEGVLVIYDYRNNRKVPVPAELKRSILDLEAGSK